MKNGFLLGAIMAVLLATACDSSPAASKGNENLQTSAINNGQTLPAPRSEAPTLPQNPEGTFATPVAPDVSNKYAALLLKTFWVAEYWVNHDDESQNRPNKGRWWRFKEDGTFVTGQWEQTYTQGSWVIYNDADKTLLHMDAADNNFDMEFEIQGLSQWQDYMSWAGTKSYGLSRIAVKAVSLLSTPTKAQFNVPE